MTGPTVPPPAAEGLLPAVEAASLSVATGFELLVTVVFGTLSPA